MFSQSVTKLMIYTPTPTPDGDPTANQRMDTTNWGYVDENGQGLVSGTEMTQRKMHYQGPPQHG